MKKVALLSFLALAATGAFAVTPQYTAITPQFGVTSHMGKKHKTKKHKKHHKM